MTNVLHPSRVHNRYWLGRCTAATGAANKFCDSPAAPDMPFPICARHAIQVWRTMQGVLEETVAADPDALMAAALGLADSSQVDPALSRQRSVTTRSRFVYYVQIGEHIKIGVTNNLDKRMRDYPPASILLAAEPGGVQLERKRHQQFADLLDARREYFRPSPELSDHIAAVVSEHGDPAIMRAKHLMNRRARVAANRLTA